MCNVLVLVLQKYVIDPMLESDGIPRLLLRAFMPDMVRFFFCLYLLI